MTRLLALVFFGFACAPACAQQDCLALSENEERLRCYDKALGYQPKPQPSEKPQQTENPQQLAKRDASSGESWLNNIWVRDEGNVSKVGKGPALVGLTHNKGEDASLIKAAVILIGPDAYTQWGIQPFASASINQNTLSTDRTSVRAATVGVTAALFDYVETGFAVWPTLSASTRKDKKKQTASNTGTLDNYLVVRGLGDGIPFKANEFQLFPKFGVHIEDQRRVTAPAQPGSSRGYFWGVTGVFWPFIMADRLQLSATYQRFLDGSISTGLTKRRENYTKLALDFYLFNRADTSYWLQPIIGIDREVGSDPITGSLDVNRTTVALKLKVN